MKTEAWQSCYYKKPLAVSLFNIYQLLIQCPFRPVSGAAVSSRPGSPAKQYALRGEGPCPAPWGLDPALGLRSPGLFSLALSQAARGTFS